jgi:uncharacterized membrane protein YhiD involved in acid resistance
VPDFLTAPFSADQAIDPLAVLMRLIIALLLGGVVAWIYRTTRPGSEYGSTFPPTLVLLSILIAMVTQVIGDSIARAFSLVGALSIVRFRTVVRDTQDTAFVIFAVVVGMASGAGDPRLALIGILVVGVAAFIMRPRHSGLRSAPGDPLLLEVRLIAQTDLDKALDPTLDAHVASRQLVNVSTAKQGAAIDAKYLVELRAGRSADDLVRALNGIESVINDAISSRTARDDDDD